MISERTLRRWRKEALHSELALENLNATDVYTNERKETMKRILILTQELLDQHLLRRKK